MNAQTKIEADSLPRAYAAAFAAIDAAIKSAKGQVGQQRYKYADLTSIIEAIKPALTERNLFFTQQLEPSTDGVTVRTVLHHACGDSLDLGALFVPANKRDAQGFGSALTYARRYALQTAFGVPTEDDDGNAAVKAGQGRSEEREVSPVLLITDDQRGELMLLLDHLNVPVAEVLKVGKIKDLRELQADRFDGVKDWINKRALELRETA